MMHRQDLQECYKRIQAHVHRTPVMSSTSINALVGRPVFFKCENFQRAGAYKIRGATNAILTIPEGKRKNGVVTHSSGNFAQALALAAKTLGTEAHIVMPKNAPNIKKNGVLAYGGILYQCEPTLEAREAMAAKIERDTGATFLHPSNNDQVILGQGTAAMELLQERPQINVVFCPVGGGGLIAGTALAAHYFGKDCLTLGGEPLNADDAYRSLLSGKIEGNDTVNTIADGLKTVLGDRNFPIIKKHVSKIVRVTEEEIITAMRLVWERMKIIIEPSSAVALAALISDVNKNNEAYRNTNVGIIVSGGNVDLQNLPF